MKSDEKETQDSTEEKELILGSLMDSEPISYIQEITEGFTDKRISEEKIQILIDEMIEDGLVKIDVETTKVNQCVCSGNWYEITKKGHEFLEQLS